MSDKIKKFIASLGVKARKRLKQRMMDLEKNPFSFSGIKKMQGKGDNVYRLRMGKIRIIYKILDDGIEIIDVDYRGNIY